MGIAILTSGGDYPRAERGHPVTSTEGQPRFRQRGSWLQVRLARSRQRADAYSHQGLDSFKRPRLGGIADILAPMIEAHAASNPAPQPLDSRNAEVPSAYDCVLATRLGMAAVDLAMQEHWGSMVALRGTDSVSVSIAEATHRPKLVPVQRYEDAAFLFG